MKPWSMLATPYDEIEYIHYPVIAQCKLNGIRAKWDGHSLITRQNKIWKPETLPDLHARLTHWSAMNPGIILDGELYRHGVHFQFLEAWTAVNRQTPHEHAPLVEFHAFDIISGDHTEARLIKLGQIYKPFVGPALCRNEMDVQKWLTVCVATGYEGLILRALGCPYIVGRTEALIKLKPWKYSQGIIVGFKEGKDKYEGVLGSIQIKWEGKFFYASGGLKDDERAFIWSDTDTYLGKRVRFKFRDTSNAGIPMHPQIEEIL